MDGPNKHIRDIPGYYYDGEKKKYFKIQASSQAPAKAAYSSSDVKRRKIRDARSAAKVEELARQKDRIRRSKALGAPLTGDLFMRETLHSNIRMSEIYARGLVNQGRLETGAYFPDHGCVFAVTPRPGVSNGLLDFRMFWNNELLIFPGNVDKEQVYENPEIVKAWSPTGGRAGSHVVIFPDPGPSTSLSINEPNGKVAVTWLSGSDRTGISIESTRQPILGDELPEDETEDPAIIFGAGSFLDTLSSVAAPSQSSLLFAFGTSSGIITLDKERLDPTIIGRTGPRDARLTDVFALEFLSNDHSILLSGGRRGLLNIIDLRIPKFGSEADIIIHPSSITHIRQLDDHRIIVAGLNSHLCQYDLRFRKDISTSSAHTSGNQRSAQNLNSTKSIVQYPDYRNAAHVQLGFDIDIETGVVAACQERTEGNIETIQLFSLYGGHKLPSPVVKHSALHARSEDLPVCPNMKCIRFVKEYETKLPTLYTMTRDLWRWAWVPEEEGQTWAGPQN